MIFNPFYYIYNKYNREDEMSRFNQLTGKAKIMNDIQRIQIKINDLYNKLIGNNKNKKVVPITKIERQFYRRQIILNMIKYSELIEEFENNHIDENDLPYLDFLIDYYLALSEEVDELNKQELKIEKILGLLNE